MSTRLFTLVGACLILLSSASSAQDSKPDQRSIDGTWLLQWEGPRGPTEMQLELSVDGDTLTGRIETRGGWQDIRDGKVTPEDFTFTVVMGREDRTFRMVFRGTPTASGELRGTVRTPRGDDLPWKGTRAK